MSRVSSSFYGWSKPVPREQWDANDPKVLEAAQPYEEVEKAVDYVFRDKGFLLAAFTHHSFPVAARPVPGCLQPMDFLGDALLKSLLSVHLYGCLEPLTPRTLTETRQRLDSNRCFGFLAVRLGFHKLLRSGSAELSASIVHYVRELESKGYQDDPANKPPKPLADLFEALFGAIYLDSDQDLAGLWSCVYPLLRERIGLELQRAAAEKK